jgi:hypothetical protein
MSFLRRYRVAVFFVRSAEKTHCPCCTGILVVIGSRQRVWYKSSGDREKLIIRRLYCEKCEKIHHELPDLLLPYRRYDAESIEGVISEPAYSDVAADESTLFRWRSWFYVWAMYAIGCLESIALQFKLPVESPSKLPQSALQSLGRYVGNGNGWLSRVVHPIVNNHLW